MRILGLAPGWPKTTTATGCTTVCTVITPAVPQTCFFQSNQTVTGVFFGAEIITDRVQKMVARHLDEVLRGELRVVVDRAFPLAEAAEAHAYLERRAAFGRVVLVP